MALPYTMLNAHTGTPVSANTNTTSQATPDSSCMNYSRDVPSPEEADTPRLAGIRAVEQLRNRLDTIDEHARELRSARHTFLRREQLLLQERDELVASLNSIEAAFMTRFPLHTSGASPPTIYNTIGDPIEEKEESEHPCKRQAVSDLSDRPTVRKRPSGSTYQAFDQGVSKPAPLIALGTEPTLIAECPPELKHLLQPSNSLPRPSSNSPPGSPFKTPASFPRSRSVTRGGIRFPPGSAPRLSRGCSTSSSPLTKMLPPPVPYSPVTPVARKGYSSTTRGLSPSRFESPISRVGAVTTWGIPVTVPRPKLTNREGRDHAGPPRLSRPLNGTIPIYLMLNPSRSLSNMDPERTPSPPIGAPRSSWAMRPDVHIKEELSDSLELNTQSVKATNETPGNEQGGPASRTRARVNGVGAFNNKGKGRS